MPRFPAKPAPPGYAIVQREGRYWLQYETAPGTWQDVAGPYTQRWTAVLRAERMFRPGAKRREPTQPTEQGA